MTGRQIEKKMTDPEPSTVITQTKPKDQLDSTHIKYPSSYVALSAAIAAVLEMMIFHPVDTVSKRLQKNKEKAVGLSGKFSPLSKQFWLEVPDFIKKNLTHFNRVLFRDYSTYTMPLRFVSLYPGLVFGTLYKIAQRTYKLTAQTIVNDFLEDQAWMTSVFGEHKKFWAAGISGMLVGAGEVVLLPLDIMKIKLQTQTSSRKNLIQIWHGISTTQNSYGNRKTVIEKCGELSRERQQLKKLKADASFHLQFRNALIAERNRSELALQRKDYSTIMRELMDQRQQTRKAIGEKSFMDVLRTENPFKGSTVTIPRNMIGSFTFFAMRYYLKNQEYINRQWYGGAAFANLMATVASIAVATPFDVVKTRTQSSAEALRPSKVFIQTLKEEGPRAFMKGGLTKIAMQGPKLFAWISAAEWLEKNLPKQIDAGTRRAHEMHSNLQTSVDSVSRRVTNLFYHPKPANNHAGVAPSNTSTKVNQPKV